MEQSMKKKQVFKPIKNIRPDRKINGAEQEIMDGWSKAGAFKFANEIVRTTFNGR
jgi:hypothetical protein